MVRVVSQLGTVILVTQQQFTKLFFPVETMIIIFCLNIDPTVWEFVKLLSQKLDQNPIQSLYGRLQSPTANMIVAMLGNHKLRSTYDFEKAIAREWRLNENLNKFRTTDQGSETISWNFRMLDLAAGPITTVDTIFELKEQGILRGAKKVAEIH